MRKYKLIEYFVDGSVREMCIKYNFYTRGDYDPDGSMEYDSYDED